jgi:uncharacterized protein (TIGR02271 family)
MLHVIAIFHNENDAQAAARGLLERGFTRDDIGYISRDRREGADVRGTERADIHRGEKTSGAVAGAGVGAAIGGVGGLLAGLAGLAIPGIGPLLAAGPIAAALGGAGVGAVAGGVTGGIIGALTDMGVPENEAKEYEEGVRRGGTLLTVRAQDGGKAERAAEIMRAHSATDVDRRGDEERDLDIEDAEDERAEEAELRAPESASDRGASRRREEAVIPVVEEQLHVGKETVQTGGVRIYGRVREQPVERDVNLREERVNVQRRPVDRQARPGEKFDEAVIEVTETKERPVVAKEERVTEEIVVAKEAGEHTEKIRGTVRRKDAQVERKTPQQKKDTA